jgi:Tfp pilus assembly protein PilN
MRAVNLLPANDRRRRAAEVPSNASYVFLGVLGALLLAVVALVMTGNSITTTKAEIARAQQETQASQARIAELGPFGQFSQVKQTRLDSVTALSSSRFDWERLMRELALVLPEDVFITEASASAAGDAEADGGDPSSTPDGAAAVGTPSLALTGCAPSQPTVAEVMVRLRNLHRAEDVELGESAKPDAVEGGSIMEGCGSDYTFNVTVTFSAAPPADEQGESGDSVPSQLGGGA